MNHDGVFFVKVVRERDRVHFALPRTFSDEVDALGSGADMELYAMFIGS
jgi:hypothetical protein